MVFFIPPKIVNKYVRKYDADVMKVVRAFRTKHELVPTGPEIAEYRQEKASKFWFGVREENPTESEEFIQALQSKMKGKRWNHETKTLRRMDLNYKGELLVPLQTTTDYYMEDPLLSDTEKPRKKPRVCESIWNLHRSVCSKLPYCTIGYTSVKVAEAFAEISIEINKFCLENKILPSGDTNHHGYGWANTVVTGATPGISGTVHWCSDWFDHPKIQPLLRKYIRAVCNMIVSAFGKDNWYLEINYFLRFHCPPCVSDRLLLNTPITNLWRSTKLVENGIHRDQKNAFVAFLMVPFTVEGGDIVITDPKCDYGRAFHMKKGMVMVGRCFQNNHFNKALKDPNAYRESSAGYYDYRIGAHHECTKKPKFRREKTMPRCFKTPKSTYI